MKKHHKIEKIVFEVEKIILKIDSQEYSFQLSEISQKLANASSLEREKYNISPSGYGIHWPLIDEDLSIDGLLGIKNKPSKIKEMALT